VIAERHGCTLSFHGRESRYIFVSTVYICLCLFPPHTVLAIYTVHTLLLYLIVCAPGLVIMHDDDKL